MLHTSLRHGDKSWRTHHTGQAPPATTPHGCPLYLHPTDFFLMLCLHGGPQTICLFEITTGVANLTSRWSVCHFILHFYWLIRSHKSLRSHCRWSSQIFDRENFFTVHLWSQDPDNGRLTMQHRSTVLEPRRKILSHISRNGYLCLDQLRRMWLQWVEPDELYTNIRKKKSSFDVDNKRQ